MEVIEKKVLDAYIFRTIDKVRQMTDQWNDYYNNDRPQEALIYDADGLSGKETRKRKDLYYHSQIAGCPNNEKFTLFIA